MRFIFGFFFWFFYMPLMRLLVLFLFWNSKVEERERFEKRNKFEALAHSFKEKNELADLCFEFSSEGEFQQVAPLIDDALNMGKKIELIFFSPSVEKGVMRLAAQYPSQIRYLRYPFLRIFPFMGRRSFSHWVTAKTLIMVRYDLFPEFLLWSMNPEHTLKIVWMTFKKERSKNKSISFWKKLFLMRAKSLVFAGTPDLDTAKAMQVSGKVFDFRIEQIKRRVEKRDEKFRQLFPLYSEFRNHSLQFQKKLILGNAWPSDLFLLRDLPKDVLLVVVPHQLSGEILNLFKDGLDDLGREVFEINDSTARFISSNTILINKKGILCELYTDFPLAYVGGGFEGSIHSVLEPLVAGSEKISCGPFHHRSTEYDVALSMDRILEVNTPEEMFEWMSVVPKESSHDKMKSLVADYETMREFVISC
jgi:3-deoxy-D-manno-octulosonic-acid transferase